MYTVLAGGVGGARFLRGLVQVVDPKDIHVIVNVGDDLERFGLRICPDLDSITYWLSGTVHPDQQWGRANESFVVAEELQRFGHESWFTLGDRDLALHLHRTARLSQGAPLSAVTREITEAFGLVTRLLPATDDPVETRIHTHDGRNLAFQEYWVRERAAPEVARVELAGAANAEPAPGVIEALVGADVIMFAPSNPVVSIGTVLAIPGIAAAITQRQTPAIGVSPIIGGRVVRGMADRLLPALGVEVSAAGVAAHYRNLLDGWVIDTADTELKPEIDALGMRCVAMNTRLDDPQDAAAVAAACLDLAQAHT